MAALKSVSETLKFGDVSGLPPNDAADDTERLAARVAERLEENVPFDWLCVGITDPWTGLVTMVQNCEPLGPPEIYLETEYFTSDVNKIAWLAQQPDPVGVLSVATGGNLERSHRYRHLLRPTGAEHELRAALVVGGLCWGYLVLMRTPQRDDFGPVEVQHVREAVPELATELRAKLLAATLSRIREQEPGFAVVTGAGELEAVTPRAAELFAKIATLHQEIDVGLPVPVATMAARLRGPRAPTSQRMLLYGRDGEWLVLYGSRLTGKDGEARVVVSVDAAPPMLLAPLLLQARGLTRREIEVAQCVLRGMPTSEIAAQLGISAYTVQDHLKSAFAKTSVRSRREFVQAVFPDVPARHL
jgi:DNA-binding CsgD family transcriptional regulator